MGVAFFVFNSYPVSRIIEDPYGLILVCMSEEIGTFSSLYRWAFEEKAHHWSANLKILEKSDVGSHEQTCCWSPRAE